MSRVFHHHKIIITLMVAVLCLLPPLSHGRMGTGITRKGPPRSKAVLVKQEERSRKVSPASASIAGLPLSVPEVPRPFAVRSVTLVTTVSIPPHSASSILRYRGPPPPLFA